MNKTSIKISVVIATRDRAGYLATCLDALLRQDYDPRLFEVIVINDGSTDATADLLSRFQKKAPFRFDFVSHENKGVSASRNIGIYRAAGVIIAFTDDDCIVPENWLSTIADDWQTDGDDIAGIGGPLNSSTGTGYVERYIHFLDEFNYIPVLGKRFISLKHVSRIPCGSPVAYLRTSNAAFRKAALLDIGGFDTVFKKPGGEDPDLCYRMLRRGYRFRFMKDLVVLHSNRNSITSYVRSMRNYIEGEFRKRAKLGEYPEAVRVSYRLIPLRKTASVFLALAAIPVTWIRLIRSPYSSVEAISFPIVLAISKLYALCFASWIQLRLAFRRNLVV